MSVQNVMYDCLCRVICCENEMVREKIEGYQIVESLENDENCFVVFKEIGEKKDQVHLLDYGNIKDFMLLYKKYSDLTEKQKFLFKCYSKVGSGTAPDIVYNKFKTHFVAMNTSREKFNLLVEKALQPIEDLASIN
ncbi:MAG: hypothetical protein PHN69_05455 [Candidatus Pacebacteria bacterium]|nr:hypothetical protein [Candidatus Paceibacterota bacterium]